MTLFSNSRRFKRFIIDMGKFSPGVVHSSPNIRELSNGRIQVNTSSKVPWIMEDENGRVYLNPDLSGGRVVEQSDGRILVNTGLV